MRSNFPPSVLIRAASIAFTSWAWDSVRPGSELGSVGLRMVVRLDSGLVSFLISGHKDSNRIDSRLRSVCSRPGSARGSAHRTSRLGTVCSRHGSARGSAHRTSGFGSAHYSRFSLPRLVDLDRLGDQLEARRISSMLGSVGSARFAPDPDQLETRLDSLFGIQFTSTRESGSTWGSLWLGESAQCSAQLSSELGSAELGARLGAQFGAKLGIGWGLRDS